MAETNRCRRTRCRSSRSSVTHAVLVSPAEKHPMSDVQVRVFDTTLRDGEQSPGFSLRPDEKLQMARQLERLGVDVIEAGFAVSSPAEAEAIRQIAIEIRRPVIASLARAQRADI